MKVVVSYDIIENRKRQKVIDILEGYGFVRVQKSVFLGDIKIRQVRKLLLELSGVIDLEKDALCILNICEKCYGKGIFISRNMNYKMIEEEFLII
ncbi:CRISPR-associated endonuclease Cas2 [Candidatus Cetobacterium colombiensis]|uniref:CRISPR-associated endoribonuclease Cas2 n=1 Tax=Candidatus Cetobacterium colombiensis TaxID=3073100 RepID=A0ABU4WFA7_9FUSO|nr:CRISPR-associated endonuclease Cas2 [Candidatus Cetobacterium colombiensis]MDX8337236.1 CRISPR-associated endonuclease Cas2 [Candidatus Cetobacterium colombiensis]